MERYRKTQDCNKKLFLLDAMALIYRAYFAFGKTPIISSSGLNTSAILGFGNTLLELLKKEKPTHIGVAFDTQAPTTRHIEFADYKANREKMPEDIGISIPYVQSLLSALNIPILSVDGYEADDVIGTLAKKAEKEGYTVYMVTPDKDYGQLVSENIYMYKPARMGNGVDVLGVKEICEKYELKNPIQIIDMLGLWGDVSDNIPGVPGVGEVTAKKLLAQFSTIEELISHSSEIKPEKLGLKIAEYANQALFSKKLATIILDVPIDFDETALEISSPDIDTTDKLLKELEMHSFASRLWKYYGIDSKGENTVVSDSAKTGSKVGSKGSKTISKTGSKTSFQALSKASEPDLFSSIYVEPTEESKSFDISATEWIGVDELEKGFNSVFSSTDILSFACACNKEDNLRNADFTLWAFAHISKGVFYYKPHQPLLKQEADFIDKYLLNRSQTWLIYNGKRFWHLCFKAGLNTDVFFEKAACRDLMLAHYVADAESSHDIFRMAEGILRETITLGSIYEENTLIEVSVLGRLWQILEAKLKETESEDLFVNIEMPLMYVLARMENVGIRIDKGMLDAYGQELNAKIVTLSQEIYTLAGVSFNISSPKQLGEILFERLQLVEKPKHTKTKQWSTAEDVLQKLIDRHPIIKLVLEYRSLSKLKSTYVDALPQLVDEQTGHIHTTYNQAVAATGRLSSQNPNLQNIPVRSDMGREIRKAFIADTSEDMLLSADYSQIELRIIAQLSKDASMLEDFSAHKDVHTSTAAKVFNVSIDEVDSTMRRMAKTVNFGIIYGISAFGLSERLGIGRKDAAELIEKYFIQYPGLKRYMTEVVEQAKENGYVETLCNRRRYLPDINSGNAIVRGYAERNAVNAPIQGSSADMIKIAMINIDKRLSKEGLKTRMILQVHDELIFNMPFEEKDRVRILVEEEMKKALSMNVPIEVDMNQAYNWSDAH